MVALDWPSDSDSATIWHGLRAGCDEQSSLSKPTTSTTLRSSISDRIGQASHDQGPSLSGVTECLTPHAFERLPRNTAMRETGWIELLAGETPERQYFVNGFTQTGRHKAAQPLANRTTGHTDDWRPNQTAPRVLARLMV
jgi:hypothetical protein